MSILIPPTAVFWDLNGRVLSDGTIQTFIEGTTTPKSTYQDDAETIANTNPVQLSSSGTATLYGTGRFRFVVRDSNQNVISDGPTSSFLDATAISPAMAPVTAAETVAVARTLMGIDLALANNNATIALLTGPTGPVGPQGVIGPAGPQGDAGVTPGGTYVQGGSVFANPVALGTWTEFTDSGSNVWPRYVYDEWITFPFPFNFCQSVIVSLMTNTGTLIDNQFAYPVVVSKDQGAFHIGMFFPLGTGAPPNWNVNWIAYGT